MAWSPAMKAWRAKRGAGKAELLEKVVIERKRLTPEEREAKEREYRARYEANRQAGIAPKDQGAERRECTWCRQTLPIYWFGKKKDGRGGYAAICIECNRIKCRLWGRTPAGLETKRGLNRNNKWRLRGVVDGYKQAQGCRRCGESDSVALDFHHRDPLKKGSEIGKLVAQQVSTTRLREELAKCTVLCANCHRKLHAGRFWIHEGGRIYESPHDGPPADGFSTIERRK